ncbi:glycosyltransferase family 2 protein [Planctomonas psychrotolerans]|uniref:glycosyltransferase family 2 protein n=1 Tax=Planctomonas psychrotolerans TaxID=2528712 RepID=UPI001D0D331A|nr:glycosyltransferase family 2 protein [Planctomonas psychrotolerans]
MPARLRERTPQDSGSPDPLAAPTVAAVIAAYNEQESIAATMDALLGQSRPPDSIFVVVNNSTDQTFDVARRYNGRHVLPRRGGPATCVVTVIDIGVNDDGKVGALNFAWSLARRHDYVLGVDADTILAIDCLAHLLTDVVADPRLGGVSAVSMPDQDASGGVVAHALVRAQRVDAATDALSALVRGGRTLVLDGTCSLLRTAALAEIAGHRQGPWLADFGVEDVRLTADLLSSGYEARVSEHARASTAPPTTACWLRGQPRINAADDERFSLDLPRIAQVARSAQGGAGSATHLASRLLAAVLAVGFASTGGLHVSGLWLVPVVLALLADLCVVSRIAGRSASDILSAVLFLPQEAYRTVKGLGHARAWIRNLGTRQCSSAAAQARAERGSEPASSADRGVIRALSLFAAGGIATVLTVWTASSPAQQEAALTAGVVLLALVLGVQSLRNARTILGTARGHRV